jgi:sugar phosphate isomerase/epimerase
MWPSLSLRGLGVPVDDPLAVLEAGLDAGYAGWHLHLHKAPPDRSALHDALAACPSGRVTWVYPVDRHLHPAAPTVEALRSFADNAHVAAELGVQVVSTWLPNLEIAPDVALRRLTPVACAAGEVGLVLAVEPERWWSSPRWRVDGVEALARERDRGGGAWGVTIDCTHVNDAAVARAYRLGLPIGDVHLAALGADGRRSSHGLARDAACRAVVEGLRAAGYRGPVMLESLGESGIPAPDAARQARLALDEVLAYATAPSGTTEGDT